MAKKHTAVLNYALEYIARGWHIFPIFHMRDDDMCSCGNPNCKRPGKHPVPRNGFNAATTDEAQIRTWWEQDPNYNIGFCPSRSGLVGTDIDCGIDKKTGEPQVGRETWDGILADPSHKLPAALSVLTGGGGEHIYLKTTRDIQKSEGRVGKDIDVRGHGGYLILPPSNHKSGNLYRFKDGAAWRDAAAHMGDLPEWLAKLMDKPAAPSSDKPAAPSSAVTARAAAVTPGADENDLQPDDPNDRLTSVQLQELLSAVPAGPRDNWLMIGGVLKTIASWFDDGQAFMVWDAWAQSGQGYGGFDDQWYQWQSFRPTRVPPIALLRKCARANGWAPSEEFQKQARTRWKTVAQQMLDALTDDAEPDSDAVTALFRALGNLPESVIDVFLEKLRKRFKWRVPVMRSEITRQRKQRASDEGAETDYGMIVARRVLASYFENGKHLIHVADGFFWKYNGRYWEQIVSEKELGNLCMTATLELGQIPKDVAVVVRQAIDNLANLQARGGDPLRLMQPPSPVINCLNGELWIKEDFTIERRDHSPDSFLRFCLDIEYDPTAVCPMFDKAVLEIFQDSPDPQDMHRHMMEIYGYAIQPSRFIKIFLIWQGGGNNGKGKLIEVLIKLAGEKAVAPGRIVDLDHEYYRANLVGKLIYYEDDMAHNTVLPDGALKQYSEAKYTSGRHAYGRIDEFVVCVLPIMLCNPWPITKDLTEGTLVRAHVVPFRHKFVKGVDLDPTLFERIIKSELSGILNHAIEGLQAVLKRGYFQEPKDCLTAKQEFLNASNPVPAFLNSGFCIQTLEEEIAVATMQIELLLEAAMKARNLAEIERLQAEIAVVAAKAEKAGIEGICQTTQEFYNNLIVWGRNEGHTWKPKKSQVERDLISLGFPVSNKSGQLTVYRVRSTGVIDRTPEPRW